MRLLIFLLLLSSSLIAQEKINVYTEQDGNIIYVFADNDEVIPMTVDVKLKLNGMTSNLEHDEGLVVVPANTKKVKIAEAKPSKRSGKIGFSMESYFYLGNVNSIANLDYVYDLPFQKGRTVEVYQGNNGRFSHQGENAIDFALDIGDEVFSAREGVVFNKVEHNDKSCKSESCNLYNNYITLYHEDGTFAEYTHLKKNGVIVNVGDKISKGDLIGYSGNTGWTTGPHLHFVVYQVNKEGQRITLKTKFATQEAGDIILKEKKHYTK